MKLVITDIKYSDRTIEWKIDINSLASYKEYQENEKADHSIWSFGDFMSFNNDTPNEIVIDVPFNDLVNNIEDIEKYIKEKLKEKTSRDVISFGIKQIS